MARASVVDHAAAYAERQFVRLFSERPDWPEPERVSYRPSLSRDRVEFAAIARHEFWHWELEVPSPVMEWLSDLRRWDGEFQERCRASWRRIADSHARAQHALDQMMRAHTQALMFGADWGGGLDLTTTQTRTIEGDARSRRTALAEAFLIDRWRLQERFNHPNRYFEDLRDAARWDRDQREREKSEARGLKLLKEWLLPEQLALYEQSGYFEVIGCDTGKRYRINRGTQLNIEELGPTGEPKCTWCFLPEGDLVAGDVMLAQKIALETNEREALKVANRFPIRTYSIGYRPSRSDDWLMRAFEEARGLFAERL